MKKLLALWLILSIVPSAPATQIARKELTPLVADSDHVLIGKVVKVDMIDGRGRSVTGRDARTGPGSENEIRLHVVVDTLSVLRTNASKVPEKLVVPLWRKWHYTLGTQREQHEGKTYILLLKGRKYERVYHAQFLQDLSEKAKIQALIKVGRPKEGGASTRKKPDKTSPVRKAPPQTGERAAWLAFAKSLDTETFAKDYPGAIRDLGSPEPAKVVTALNVLGATEKIAAVPFMVPLLDSADRRVRIYAGSGLERIVSGIELKRRDRTTPGKMVLRPRTGEDPDLTPLRWVVRKMLTSRDTPSYAATMAAYIGLPELEKELRALLQSRHPAVQRSATHALKVLGLQGDEEPDR